MSAAVPCVGLRFYVVQCTLAGGVAREGGNLFLSRVFIVLTNHILVCIVGMYGLACVAQAQR